MDAKVEHLINDPAGGWGVVGSLLTLAAGGVLYVGKALFKSKKAKRMLDAGFETEDNKGSTQEAKDNQTVVSALLAFIKSMESDRQADRAERGRQWERIEEIIELCRSNAEQTRNVIVQVDKGGQLFQQALVQISKDLDDISKNQIKLSEWLRERSPSQSQRYRQG